ncbi:hypothetical protein [Streptomyces sp. NPDC053728]|uniref:hypothetical protein n=1 Tax=Streptomyces sp. NPDC053728 TaxID=3155534 RepID=UPI00341918BB
MSNALPGHPWAVSVARQFGRSGVLVTYEGQGHGSVAQGPLHGAGRRRIPDRSGRAGPWHQVSRPPVVSAPRHGRGRYEGAYGDRGRGRRAGGPGHPVRSAAAGSPLTVSTRKPPDWWCQSLA